MNICLLSLFACVSVHLLLGATYSRVLCQIVRSIYTYNAARVKFALIRWLLVKLFNIDFLKWTTLWINALLFACVGRARDDVETTTDDDRTRRRQNAERRSQITDYRTHNNGIERRPRAFTGRARDETAQLGLPDYEIVLKTTSKSNLKRSQRASCDAMRLRLRCQRRQNRHTRTQTCVSVGLLSFIIKRAQLQSLSLSPSLSSALPASC